MAHADDNPEGVDIVDRSARQISQLIHPLVETYELEHLTAPEVEEVTADEMPEPFRTLLAHRNDMTPTLERFHGRRIELRVLRRQLRGNVLLRQVALVLEGLGTPVEFGAIDIHLDRFEPAPRREIEECRRPLGTLLAEHNVLHHNRPDAFLRVQPDEIIMQALGLPVAEPLYGRCNTIYDMQDRPMAEIVELIPPVNSGTTGES